MKTRRLAKCGRSYKERPAGLLAGQQPYMMGRKAVEIAKDIRAKKAVPSLITIPIRNIDQSNCQPLDGKLF